MARIDTNRSAEMEVFIRVVDLGGFTPAARRLRLTPSGVSKLISRLEARLGTRLVNRTTRKLQLTEEGQAFYQRAVRILAEIEEAEREAASGTAPRGRLTVNSNIPFGMLHVMPLIPRFLAAHPEVTLDLVLTDTVIDLMEERADVAIRVGPLRASRLIARKLGTSRMVVVAAPDYLDRFGVPKTPADLADHRGIGWTFPRSIRGWPFRRGDRSEEALPPPAARASDGEAARNLALGGVGLARLALFHIGPDIEAGRLIPVLQGYNPGDREDIHAVYVGHSGPLPARVRTFIDFLAQHVSVGDPALKRTADGKWKVQRGS
ncbi:LysR family transcriptional regulator [Bradyrhizobium sp. INPA01-394B]|uniref:LysR family transcriptional regulator n=1 Tax=Bradyrhizobium campsiandrae TaxID=1729892 RepID=A0ABR7UJD7_9BRAD|nr:LysR family transcriptional regulator [Bradyrhizobium campsiandrae]MBC9879699.1 LysR family transcriptional regulator [Bradyrhizobium campsiandrae]MBC9983716.1 LysR family transcriptional regulator [Bradyrhizobium campsiandrae]